VSALVKRPRFNSKVAAARTARWLVAALLVASSLPEFALEPSTPLANYGRQSWVMENGLPQNTVQAMVQTKNGFVWLGTGQDDEPDYHRIESADTELFGEIYCQSTKLLSPDLPFDEAFRPCLVFLAARHPKLYAKQFMDPKQGYKRYHPHTLAVLQAIGQPIPTGIHRSVE